MNRGTRLRALAHIIALRTLALTPLVGAQSLTAAEVTGSVRDAAGAAVGEADVTLTDVATGVSRAATATRAGRYQFPLEPPGEYQLLVEHLGYRPVRVLEVLLRAGASLDVPITLTPTPPPVARVDTIHFGGAGSGPGEWFSFRAVWLFPDERGEITDLGRLSTASSSDLASDGLPGSLSGILLDGVPYRPARHPGLSGGQFDASPLPVSGFDGAVLAANGADIEWSGFSGATLSAFSRQGTPHVEPHFYADGTGDPVSSSKYFDTGAVPNSSFRGGVLFSGPLVHDSAQFVFGLDARRLETPLPLALSPGAATDSVVALAQDSFGVSLNDYRHPRIVRSDALTAFAGLKWRISASSDVAVEVRYATATTTNPDLGLGPAPSVGASLDSREFLGGATLHSGLSEDLTQELRVGLQLSTRTYSATTPPATDFVDLGTPVGSDPALPGRFRRSSARASESLYYQVGVHRLKVGLAGALNSYDQTYGFGSAGTFTFSGPSDFAQRRGVFAQTVFASRTAQFSVPEYGLYLQDLITPVPGLDVLLGLRYDYEGLPRDKVIRNAAWLQASGLDNTVFGAGLHKFSPRVGFTWDVEQRHRTEVRAVAGVYFDEVDPGGLGEVITGSLGDTVRRAVGLLAAWPAPPDATHAPLVGPSLTLLAHDFQAPRAGRVSLGVWRALPAGLAVRIAGTYGHSDYLPRRRDLNLPLAPSAHDQYGRPIYGTLIQQGDLLAVQPGSNRRFSAFDLVSAISPDGYSDYWGVTATLERQVGHGLHLLASYTYSRTTDNWLSGRGGGPAFQLSPFPAGLAGRDWAKGRSDFDVPDRVVVAAELRAGVPLAPRLAFVYRYRSGQPFTPGFRSGVDASGAGSIGNDPAFVDPSIPGLSNLLSQWPCLAGQVGRFAERNACREAGVHSLDLRAMLDVARPGRFPVEVVVDALNVLESDVGARDRALYVVDPTRTISTNTATATVTVPLSVNPGFGKVLVHRTTGREFRIGLRVNY